MALANCDIWTEVDFGNGPVEIRCTEMGFHTQHKCHVEIVVEEEAPPNEVPVGRHNIFDHYSEAS